MLGYAQNEGLGHKVAVASKSNVVINEIMAANVDVYRDPSTNFGSWVELYNPTSEDVKLGGLYISDDPQNLKKHRLVNDYGTLKALNFAILNFDHHDIWTKQSYRQIDDKLDVDGGTIIISDGVNIIAQQDYPQAISRMSYARVKDGGNTWSFTGVPTPGVSNQESDGYANEQLPKPVVDKPGCLFNGSMLINVEIPKGATLRYTTDGTTPTLTKGSVSVDGKFNITSTTCFRFRLFKDGYLPSAVTTCSYILNNGNEPFPIISVVMDRANFDSNSNYGLFTKSSNGRPGNGQTDNCNWNMDWDRPVNMEYITEEGECVVSQECDMSACGGWSRAWSPHSFKLKATKQYDLKSIFEYQFFEDKPFLNNKTLQIRNGGNDTSARVKDASIQQVAARSGIYVDYQAWQPVHVYINGKAYAVLNMREPNNKHYAYSNYGIDTDEMEQFEISPDSGYVQMVGTGEYFKKLYNLSATAAEDDTYEEICKIVDIDEYINYMAIELYAGGDDWPQNNVKGFIGVNDGKFHFVLFDMDFALNSSSPLKTFQDKNWYSFNSLLGYDYSKGKSIAGTRLYKENEFVTIFLNLLKNSTFQKKFIDAFCLVGGSVYTPTRVKKIVSEVSAYLGSGGYVNCSGTANQVISGFTNRQGTMMNHIASYFKLSNSTKHVVSLSSNVAGAKLFVNDMEVPTGEFNGTLFGPVTYKAAAPAGYKFAGWKNGGSKETKSVFGYGSKWKYSDTNISSSSWKTSEVAFSTSGNAPIGYGKSGLKTTVTGNKLTYYFGQSFDLDTAPSSNDTFVLNFTIDDGAIVYVNGKEAGRYNMPYGNVGYNTAASTYAPNNPDTGSMEIDYSLFKKGKNYIAVEVHNNQTSSSDIYWDAELTRSVPIAGSNDYISTDEEYAEENAGSYSLTAYFDPIAEEELASMGVTPIKINEVSAANTVAVNDNFKKKDWIELYNTTEDPIDVAGMYLSDNIDKPQKYQIPAGAINTIIEPHGYLVVWADEKEGTTQLHTNFKLGNNEGEQIILTSEDGSWHDVLTYTPHLGSQSVGLYPDGSNNVYVLDTPTVGKGNLMDSYATFYIYNKVIDIPVPGPDNIADVPSDVIAQSYYSVSGAYMGTSRQSLSNGIYIVKYKTADGMEYSKKILVK